MVTDQRKGICSAIDLVSPVWFVMSPGVVEPTVMQREFGSRVTCACPGRSGTLMVHGADTHLVRTRF